MNIYDALWGGWLRKTITSLVTTLAAIFGLIAAAPPALEAWDGGGLPTIATRGWARVQIAEYKGVKLDIANGKKEAAEGRLDQLELDYLRAPDEQQKLLNLQAQRKQKDTIERLKDQIKSIEAK